VRTAGSGGSMGRGRRQHAPPVVTPLAVAAELSSGSRGWRPMVAEPNVYADDRPAVLDEPGAAGTVGRVEPRRERRKSGRASRVLGVMAATLLLVGSTLVGLQL